MPEHDSQRLQDKRSAYLRPQTENLGTEKDPYVHESWPVPEALVAMKSVVNWEGGSGLTAYKINPRVSFGAAALIWSFIIVMCVMPEVARKGLEEAALVWLNEVWCWFYIVSQNIWLAVLMFILITPKYANLTLARPNEPPEYSFATWFSLLFSAGLAVGLFYYGVSEPLWHFKGQHYQSRWISNVKGYGNISEDATHALMVTWYHWGIHGWIGYTTMGAVLGLLVHRRGFPMAMRFVFYPLISTRTHGLFGDFIDIMSIVTTICGVSCSLGIGTMALNAGFARASLGWYRGTLFNVPPNSTTYSNPTCGDQGKRCEPGQQPYGIGTNTETQITIVACVTCMATASVVSGLNTGIVNLSRFTFALGMGILLTVLFMGETYHYLNVITQVAGYTIWYLPKIAFQTDAYESLGHADLGGAGPEDASGGQYWMPNWTLFYWGWWISWAPFVGTFIAKISKGRTMRMFIVGTTIIPSIYSSCWVTIFGAEGIRMQKIADATGLCKVAAARDITVCQQEGSMRAPLCYNYAASYTPEQKERMMMGFNPDCVLDPVWHNGLGRCREFKWTRRVEVGQKCVETTSWIHMPCQKHPQAYGGPGNGQDGEIKDPTHLPYPPVRGPCKGKILMAEVDPRSSKRTYNWFYGAQPRCFVPLPEQHTCIYNQNNAGFIFFDTITSLGPKGWTDWFSMVNIVAMVVYFVTSSDSGSYVVDMFASNGDEDPPTSQRIFWSITEGACCAALMYSGKNLPDPAASLRALQSATLLTGLPYTFILFWVSQSLVLLCKEEIGIYPVHRPRFRMFILELTYPTRLIVNSITPGITMGRIIGFIGGWPLHGTSPLASQIVFTIIFQGMYLAAIGLTCMNGILEQWHIVGLVMYLGVTMFLAFLRNGVRNKIKIARGDLMTDINCAIFAPMFTLTQMEVELFFPKEIEEDDLKKKSVDPETEMMLTKYGLPRE